MDNRPTLADTSRTDIVMRLRIELLSLGVTLACLWTDRQPASQRDIDACCGVLLQYKFGQELHHVAFTSTHNWGASKTPDAIVGGGT